MQVRPAAVSEPSIDGDVHPAAVSEPSIDGDPGTIVVRRKRKREEAQAGEGPLSVCIIIASAHRHAVGWHRWRHREPQHELEELWSGEDAVAGACVFRWTFHATVDPDRVPESAKSVCEGAASRARGLTCGFFTYNVLSKAEPSDFVPCASTAVPIVRRHVADTVWAHRSHLGHMSRHMPFDDLLQKWQAEFEVREFPCAVLKMNANAFLHLFDCVPCHTHAVALPCRRREMAHALRRCMHISPTRQELGRLISSAAAAAPRKPEPRRTKKRMDQYSAAEFVEYLRASASCTSLRKVPRAGKAWGRNFQRHSDVRLPDPQSFAPAYDQIRRARIRLDSVAMLATRHFS